MIDRHPDVIGHHVLKLKINSTHSFLMRKRDANAVTIARKLFRWRESFAINGIITRSFENLPVHCQQGRHLHAYANQKTSRDTVFDCTECSCRFFCIVFRRHPGSMLYFPRIGKTEGELGARSKGLKPQPKGEWTTLSTF
jgi:hypothetical protein